MQLYKRLFSSVCRSLCRFLHVSQKPRIQKNSKTFKGIQENSRKFVTTIGRVSGLYTCLLIRISQRTLRNFYWHLSRNWQRKHFFELLLYNVIESFEILKDLFTILSYAFIVMWKQCFKWKTKNLREEVEHLTQIL